MTFLQLAEASLKDSRIYMTPKEIWEHAEKIGVMDDFETKGKTPVASLSMILGKHLDRAPNMKKHSSTPARYIYDPNNEACEEDVEIKTVPGQLTRNEKRYSHYLEKHLHPFLCHFAFHKLGVYTRTINHTKSRKHEFGEWVHPDMVGVDFPGWEDSVLDLSQLAGNSPIKICSFELKIKLSLSKLREYFFQAVSNSSWANESYLVAGEISNDPGFIEELSRLSAAFGVGVIKLNTKDPHKSKIFIPAKTRELMDWKTINKLTMNPDFGDFISRVRNDVRNKEITNEKYDDVLDDEKLISSIKEI